MGITIKAKKNTPTALDCGYCGFGGLRMIIADAIDHAMGVAYEQWYVTPCNREANWIALKSVMIKLYRQDKITQGVIDFLLDSDCEASLPVARVKELWQAIKSIDIDYSFGYEAYHCATFKDFKNLVEWCATNKSALVWD